MPVDDDRDLLSDDRDIGQGTPTTCGRSIKDGEPLRTLPELESLLLLERTRAIRRTSADQQHTRPE